jgi:hypothetical protein
LKGPKPEWPCMESKLFKEWKFGAGSFLGGDKQGRIPLKHTASGSRFSQLAFRRMSTKPTAASSACF